MSNHKGGHPSSDTPALELPKAPKGPAPGAVAGYSHDMYFDDTLSNIYGLGLIALFHKGPKGGTFTIVPSALQVYQIPSPVQNLVAMKYTDRLSVGHYVLEAEMNNILHYLWDGWK
jgi:hypothetical protein